MRRILKGITPYVATLPLLLVSGAALASGGENACEAGLDSACMQAIGIHAANFLLFFVFLFFVARKPISEVLRQRQAQVKQDIDDANASRKAAQERFDGLEARLARFEQELGEMKAVAKAAADRDTALHRKHTAEEIERLKDQATRAIREEGVRAHRKLREQVVDLAIHAATDTLRGKLSATDHTRLNNEFLIAVNPGAANA
jgi:F-type H+-transporting ATPase subunit b